MEQQPDGAGRFVRQLREEVVVRSPSDAAHHLLEHVFAPIDAFDQEELWVVLLNTRKRITHEALVYRGTVNTIYVRPAELFKEAVRANAPGLLLTQDAYQAGQLLGIEVLDHIIVGRENWVSLRERGLGFTNS